MSFVDELKISYEEAFGFKSLFANGLPDGLRFMDWLNINDEYSLSIQASGSSYCIPRALIDLNDYTHFEMAVIIKDIDSGTNEFYTDTELYDGFERVDELLEHQEGSIYTYVPKDLIEDLYKWLKENK